jgi:uracil-DNA glycosylase
VVGEQPGDVEDLEGHPFVGPAGRELDRAFATVGLGDVPQYRTNVVKHFKWSERRGKRRIHESPSAIEIRSCLPWLQEELRHTDPAVLVLLGATAVKGLLGPKVKVTAERGKVRLGPRRLVTIPTVHPSSVLRARSDRDRYAAREAFEADLAVVAEVVRDGPTAALERLTVAIAHGPRRRAGRRGPEPVPQGRTGRPRRRGLPRRLTSR